VEDSGHTDCSSLPLTEEPRAQNLVLLTWDTTRRRSDGAAVWSTPLAEAVAEQDEYPNYAVEVGSGGLAVRVGDKLFGIPL